MTTVEVACFSLPRGGKSRRKRGQPVLSGLVSTDAFTNHPTLTVAKRMLILFLAVVLADEHGSLASLHERLKEAGDAHPQHWAAGRNLTALQSRTSKWLGKYAVRLPKWEVIVECLQLQVPREHLPRILAVAAGLHCRARQLPGPPEGYTGDIDVPEGALHTRATPEIISAHLQTLLTPPAAEAPAVTMLPQPQDLPELSGSITGELDVAALIRERDQLKETLSLVLRGFNEVEATAEKAQARVEELQRSFDLQKPQFVQNMELTREMKLLQRKYSRLETICVAQIRLGRPNATRKTILKYLDDQVANVGTPRRGAFWEFTRTPDTGEPGAPHDASSVS
jgi:hypothetical protein